MKMFKRTILTLLAAGAAFLPARAPAMTNYYVATNGPHIPPYDDWSKAATNIQDVVALARNDDRINISNGTFVVTSELTVAYAMTIRGEYGPEQTVLTGAYPDYTNRCFDLNHGGAWLDGLTISNFYNAGHGGALQLRNGNMTNCHVTHNQTLGTGRWGGGIHSTTAWTGLVTHCRISYNVNTNQFGGGMAMEGSSGTGGGMLRESEIYGNNGWNVGGVFFNRGIIDRCVIRDNICSGQNSGGGVAGSSGAGSNSIVRNSLIMRNDSYYAGGIYLNSNSFSVVNCTIVSNHARSAIGGLRTSSDTHPVMRQMFVNCIIYSNTAGVVASDLGLGVTHHSNWFYNCCVGTFVLPEQQGNLTDHPAFVNPDPADPDYPLQPGSPCINGGTNHPWIADLDLDGRRRIDWFGRVADMGCFEYTAAGSLFQLR